MPRSHGALRDEEGSYQKNSSHHAVHERKDRGGHVGVLHGDGDDRVPLLDVQIDNRGRMETAEAYTFRGRAYFSLRGEEAKGHADLLRKVLRGS